MAFGAQGSLRANRRSNPERVLTLFPCGASWVREPFNRLAPRAAFRRGQEKVLPRRMNSSNAGSGARRPKNVAFRKAIEVARRDEEEVRQTVDIFERRRPDFLSPGAAASVTMRRSARRTTVRATCTAAAASGRRAE